MFSDQLQLHCNKFNSCRGFEPARAEHNGLAVHRLNHSATLLLTTRTKNESQHLKLRTTNINQQLQSPISHTALLEQQYHSTITMTTTVPLAQSVTFREVCGLFELIKARSKNKQGVLEAFIADWRKSGYQDPEIDSFYPVMRLLLPWLDMSRSAYNLKEAKLRKLYTKVLGLTESTGDGLKLKEFKNPEYAGGNAGDLPLVFLDVLRDRCPRQVNANKLTVADINRILDTLANAGVLARSEDTSKGEANLKADQQRQNVIDEMLCRGGPKENMWFIRIILKDLKIKLKEETVWKAFHRQAAEFWGRCTDLKKLCIRLHDPHIDVLEQIHIGQPCGVMLAQDFMKKSIDAGMRHIGPAFIMEIKYDGERIHLHKHGNSFHYFSRNRVDFSSAYNSDDRTLSHAKNISHLFHSSVKTCILDGEMVGFDRESQSVVVKGDNFDVKALGRQGPTHDKYPNAMQCYIVFDIIYLNGEPWYDRPLRERKQVLSQILIPDNERMIVAPYQIGRNSEDFLKFANLAIDHREEGVIIKDIDSKYILGRRDKSWIKWKPEYIDALADTLDLLIVGGYHGEGTRRSGGISHFLLAVAEPPAPGEKPKQFNTFCKVGTGYSLGELRDIQSKLRPHWKNAHDRVRLAMPGFKEKPDVWIEPEKSLIVQIKAAEICPSEKFAARYTLRFPRLQRFRHDKNWWECALQTELPVLYERASGKIAHKTLENHHLAAENGKRATKRAKNTSTLFRVAEHFKPADLSGITQRSDIFSAMRFKVMGIDAMTRKVLSKQDLERQIKEFGGTPVQRYEKGVIPISDIENVSVRALPADIDILKTSWVVDSCRLGVCLPYKPRYLLHTSIATQEALKELVDEYGDTFEEELTEDEFDDMMAQLTSQDGQYSFPMLSHMELAEVEAEYTSALQPLRLSRVYLDQSSESKDNEYSTLKRTALEVEFLGGQILKLLDETCTHVLVDDDGDLRGVREYDCMFRSWPQRPKIVGCKWVLACLASNREVEESGYMVRASSHDDTALDDPESTCSPARTHPTNEHYFEPRASELPTRCTDARYLLPHDSTCACVTTQATIITTFMRMIDCYSFSNHRRHASEPGRFVAPICLVWDEIW
eukprot:gene9635-1856_t